MYNSATETPSLTDGALDSPLKRPGESHEKNLELTEEGTATEPSDAEIKQLPVLEGMSKQLPALGGMSLTGKSRVSSCGMSVTSGDIWPDGGSKMSLAKGMPMGRLYAICYPVVTVAFLIAATSPQMPEAPLHLFDNVLDWSLRSKHRWFVAIPILMWVAHFARRFIEVILLYSSRKEVKYPVAILSVVVRSFFCFCIGWSLNYNLDYESPSLGFMIVGLLVFVTGEVGNCLCHIHIIRTTANRVVTLGGIFNYISRPHYLFEIMSWLGFALATFTLPTLMFLFLNTSIHLVRGHQRHIKYRELEMTREGREVGTTYCAKRKAVIPFLF